MFTLNSKSVNVDRIALLEVLRSNLAIHEKDYAEAVLGFKVKALVDLQSAIMALNDATPEEALQLDSVKYDRPISHINDYKEVIEMLEFSVDTTIQLDSNRFQAYVKNQWTWSTSFSNNTAVLKGFAAAAKLI